jgi:methanol dehydrogenase (cytochrome c) subunit 2
MKKMIASIAAIAAIGIGASTAAVAYDGTKCKAEGNCWEPKPGYPDKVAGSKYDPKHSPAELKKQGDSMKAMEERNKKRAEAFKKSGNWTYDVKKIQ